VSTGDWLALGGIAVGIMGITAGGFFALSRRLDLHETRLNELGMVIARWWRDRGGDDPSP